MVDRMMFPEILLHGESRPWDRDTSYIFSALLFLHFVHEDMRTPEYSVLRQLYDTLLRQKEAKSTFSFCSVDRCDATLALERHH
jgi:hypothetical protein